MTRAVLIACMALSVGCGGLFENVRATRRGGYAVARSNDHFIVRAYAGARAKRFQGTISAPQGRILGVIVGRAELRDRVALDGESIQFDLEPSGAGNFDSFDFAVSSDCARLELLIDGKPRAAQVEWREVRVTTQGNTFVVCGGAAR